MLMRTSRTQEKEDGRDGWNQGESMEHPLSDSPRGYRILHSEQRVRRSRAQESHLASKFQAAYTRQLLSTDSLAV